MIRIAISKGNTKLGNVPNLSLPPGPEGSCRKDAPCWTSGLCYARKAWRQYPNVREAWTRNWDLWKENPAEFEDQVNAYVSEKKPPRFRWHSGGDIPDQNYFDMMVRVATKNPGTKFLAFTKRYGLDLDHKCDNLSIVLSRWPGLEFPEELDDKPQAHFKDGDKSTGSGAPCAGSCKKCNMCWTLGEGGGTFGDVLFTKH